MTNWIGVAEEMVTDKELESAFAGTNFGKGRSNRKIVAETLLKIAGDYHTGYTAICVCQELGLLGKIRTNRMPALTHKGRRYLFAAHYKGNE